jgi:type II secretory pathway pseudopilin PulG
MRRTRAGSSFIEALIGMAILAIALLGLAQLFLFSIANNTRGAGIGQATFLAQQKIDYIRTLTNDEIGTFPSAARGESIDETLDMNQDGTADFRRLTIVTGSGYSWSVLVLVFPGSQSAPSAETLTADPGAYKVLAIMNTVVGR